MNRLHAIKRMWHVDLGLDIWRGKRLIAAKNVSLHADSLHLYPIFVSHLLTWVLLTIVSWLYCFDKVERAICFLFRNVDLFKSYTICMLVMNLAFWDFCWARIASSHAFVDLLSRWLSHWEALLRYNLFSCLVYLHLLISPRFLDPQGCLILCRIGLFYCVHKTALILNASITPNRLLLN